MQSGAQNALARYPSFLKAANFTRAFRYALSLPYTGGDTLVSSMWKAANQAALEQKIHFAHYWRVQGDYTMGFLTWVSY